MTVIVLCHVSLNQWVLRWTVDSFVGTPGGRIFKVAGNLGVDCCAGKWVALFWGIQVLCVYFPMSVCLQETQVGGKTAFPPLLGSVNTVPAWGTLSVLLPFSRGPW